MVSSIDLVEGLLLAIGVALVIAYLIDRRLAAKSRVSIDIGSLHPRYKVPDTPIAVPDEPHRPKLTIIFASQSGTGQAFANNLCREATSRGCHVTLVDIEVYNYVAFLQHETTVVFYMATHGEGDPPDCAVDFDEWLMTSELAVDLCHLKYAVFALGNRQYQHFCKMGTKVDARLNSLGAERLMKVGLGDDDKSIEEDEEEWRTRLWPILSTHLSLTTSTDLVSMVPRLPSYRLVYAPDGTPTSSGRRHSLVKQSSLSVTTPSVSAPVVCNRQLLQRTKQNRTDSGSSIDQSTVHIEFDITSLNIQYITGDTLGVQPRNDQKIVAMLCSRLNIDPDRPFFLRNLATTSTESNPLAMSRLAAIPQPTTARSLLTSFFDIQNAPRKPFVGFLSQYAQDTAEKQRLLNMSLPEGKDDYHEHCIDDRKTILEFLTYFPSVCVPFEHFAEECAALQPRMFTIASSNVAQPSRIALTVGVVIGEPKKDGRIHQGVCSSYLESCRPDKDCCVVFIRESALRLPNDPSIPVIMIATGTGIAPFRGFIQERCHQLANGTLGVSTSTPWHLFYGVRSKKIDFLYAEELFDALQQGALTELHSAFSRDDPDAKVYVQDRLAAVGSDLIWPLIDTQSARIYICGSMNMGRSVRETLVNIVSTNGGISSHEAAVYIESMVEKGRLITEVWG